MGLGSCRRRRSSSYCRSLAHSRTQTTHGPGPDHRSQPGTCRSFDFGTTGAALHPRSAGNKPTSLSAQRPGRAPVRLRLQRAPDQSSRTQPHPHTKRPQCQIPPTVSQVQSKDCWRRKAPMRFPFLADMRRSEPARDKLRSARQFYKPLPILETEETRHDRPHTKDLFHQSHFDSLYSLRSIRMPR